MSKNKDLKRRVRGRMKKTGESYTSARAQLVSKRLATSVSDEELDALAGMRSETVKAKTGRTWREWLRTLDASGAASKTHREIAGYVHTEHDVTEWWSQSVTVGYERIRGLREKGQRRGGGFDVNKSKTFTVPIAALYDAFSARARKQWLDVDITVKKATREKSMRLRLGDGSPVEAYFSERGAEKSQVQLQHRSLPTKAAADEARERWSERLQALGRHLASKG